MPDIFSRAGKRNDSSPWWCSVKYQYFSTHAESTRESITFNPIYPENAVLQQIVDIGLELHVRSLVIDGVQGAEEVVVGICHLSCDPFYIGIARLEMFDRDEFKRLICPGRHRSFIALSKRVLWICFVCLSNVQARM